MKLPPLAPDAESSHGVPVVVGEEREVQVERLTPSDVAVRRVTRDGDGPDSDLFKLVAPVTQKLKLGRSSSAPVEEIEGDEERVTGSKLGERVWLVRLEPHAHFGEPISDVQHRFSLPH